MTHYCLLYCDTCKSHEKTVNPVTSMMCVHGTVTLHGAVVTAGPEHDLSDISAWQHCRCVFDSKFARRYIFTVPRLSAQRSNLTVRLQQGSVRRYNDAEAQTVKPGL